MLSSCRLFANAAQGIKTVYADPVYTFMRRFFMRLTGRTTMDVSLLTTIDAASLLPLNLLWE